MEYEYRYLFTETAEADIDSIFAYISINLSNPDAARNFAGKLEESFDELCRKPASGRLVENEYLKRDDVRRILVGNYIAYYLTDDMRQEIIVLRVVYGKMDQDKILKDI